MDYSTFLEATKHMKAQNRGEFFHSLSDENQKQLMDDYYEGAKPDEMLLQVRIISAAEMIEEEMEKKTKDINKIISWMKLYNQLVNELEDMK